MSKQRTKKRRIGAKSADTGRTIGVRLWTKRSSINDIARNHR